MEIKSFVSLFKYATDKANHPDVLDGVYAIFDNEDGDLLTAFAAEGSATAACIEANLERFTEREVKKGRNRGKKYTSSQFPLVITYEVLDEDIVEITGLAEAPFAGNKPASKRLLDAIA